MIETNLSSRRSPSDDVKLLELIQTFIADAADVSVDQVGEDANIYEDIGVDSLGATAIFIDISYAFGVPEPKKDFDYAAFNTARMLVRYVRERESEI